MLHRRSKSDGKAHDRPALHFGGFAAFHRDSVFSRVARRIEDCAETMGVTMRYARRPGGIIGVIVLVWLLVGGLAAWRRGDFKSGETDCATTGTIAHTVITGPLNYAGVNPKVTHSDTTVVMLLEGNFQPLGDDAHR